MVRKREALEGSRASQDFLTGFVGNDRTVSVCDDTTHAVAPSRLKLLLVAALARIFGWSPTLAIVLAYAIAWCWVGWREA